MGEGVSVGVDEGMIVGVGEGVSVGIGEGVSVGVGESVSVGVDEGAGVNVLVGVGLLGVRIVQAPNTKVRTNSIATSFFIIFPLPSIQLKWVFLIALDKG